MRISAFLLSSHINLEKEIFAHKDIHYLYNIYVKIKFSLINYPIVPKNALLNSFSNHYFWNQPV